MRRIVVVFLFILSSSASADFLWDVTINTGLSSQLTTCYISAISEAVDAPLSVCAATQAEAYDSLKPKAEQALGAMCGDNSICKIRYLAGGFAASLQGPATGGVCSNVSGGVYYNFVNMGGCPEECPSGNVETFGYIAGTWTEQSFQFTGGPSSVCSSGCTYNSFPSSALDVLWYDNGTVWVNEEFISDGTICSGQPDAPSESPPDGVPDDEWPGTAYCDQGGGSTGSWFCDTRDPNHPEYDPSLPPTEPGAIYCDEQGGHDGRSFCNTWSPYHPGHPDYDGTGDGSGGTSGGTGSYPGPGGGGTGGTGEGGEGEEPPQIGFCPPGTVQSERHFHGKDQTAVCVPEGEEFSDSLDGLDLSGELPPGWLVMPTLPTPVGGTCACPADHSISVMGSSVPISYGPICGVAELLRPVFLLLVYLGLAFFLFRMVAGGNK